MAIAQIDHNLTTGYTPRIRVLQGVERLIREGRLNTGDRLPSERALAERFGVARGTVRSAVHELKKQGLLHAASPRRRVVKRRATTPKASGVLSDTVCVLTRRLGDQITDRIVSTGWELFIERGALDAVFDAGLHGTNLYPELVEGEGLAKLVAGRPRGVVLGRYLGTPAGATELIHAFRDAGIPMVVYGNQPECAEFDRVYSDHESGAYQATRHLIAQGRKRILRLHTAGVDDAYWFRDRNRGYQRAMHEAGLEVLEPMVVNEALPHSEGQEARFRHNARTMAGYLLPCFTRADPVDAVMCVSDGDIFPVAAGIRLHGLVPGRDVAIAGYDNYWADRIDRRFEPCVPNVTMDKRNREIGQQLVSLLLERIENKLPTQPQARVVVPTLVVPDDGPGSTV